MDLEAISTLAAARSTLARSRLAERRVAVELLRELLVVAGPAIRREMTPRQYLAGSPALLVRDDRIVERNQQGHDEWITRDGWILYVDRDGFLEVEIHEFEERYEEPRWGTVTEPRRIGLREVARNWRGERVARGLLEALDLRAFEHTEEAAKLDESSSRMQAALAALLSTPKKAITTTSNRG